MLTWETGTYGINFFNGNNYDPNSSDNIQEFDNHHLAEIDQSNTSQLGIHVIGGPGSGGEEHFTLLEAGGGSTGVHPNCATRFDDLIITCCGDHIFAIEMKTGKLVWKTQADSATCFEVFKFEDKICVHGELEISLYTIDGKKLWSHSGRDIFTTPEGKDDFKIEDGKIYAKDWDGNKYVFDSNGPL